MLLSKPLAAKHRRGYKHAGPGSAVVPRASGPFSAYSFWVVLPGAERHPQPFPSRSFSGSRCPTWGCHKVTRKGQGDLSLHPTSLLCFLCDPPRLGFSLQLPFILGAPFPFINSATRLRKCAPCDSSAQRIYEPSSQGKESGHKSHNI